MHGLPTQLDFQPAPAGAYVSATIIAMGICTTCQAPLLPVVGMLRGEPAAGIIECRCGKAWRFLFQSRLEVATPPVISPLSLASHLPAGLPLPKSPGQ